MTEIRPRWEWRSFGRRFGGAEAYLAQLTPSGVQESDEIYLLCRRRRQRQGPRRADGHQGAAGSQRRWPGAVDAGHEGRFSASCGRGGEGVRVAGAAGPASMPRELHAGRVHRAVRRAGRGDPRGEGAQAAHALHGGWLHGRVLRRGGERQAHPHDRRRVGGRGRRGARRSRARPGRLHEHQLSPRPRGPDRRRAGALRRDRRRHQFDQVPRRRARRGRRWRTRRRPRRDDPPRRGARRSRARSSKPRWSARSPPSPAWSTRRSGSACGRSPPSARPACAWLPTATTSSQPSGRAPACRSK